MVLYDSTETKTSGTIEQLMQIPKKYFHDRAILLLLTLNTFLTFLCAILVLLRLDSRATGYIAEYRVNLGINAFKTGGVGEIVAFILFAAGILVTHAILSMRSYDLNRSFSLGILCMGTLLISLTIIISNALLVLR